jgi:hypothetical protein
MSWLNLNQSLSSLKGQITNFASEVLSEPSTEDVNSAGVNNDSKVTELEDKCRSRELEVSFHVGFQPNLGSMTGAIQVMFLCILLRLFHLNHCCWSL